MNITRIKIGIRKAKPFFKLTNSLLTSYAKTQVCLRTGVPTEILALRSSTIKQSTHASKCLFEYYLTKITGKSGMQLLNDFCLKALGKKFKP